MRVVCYRLPPCLRLSFFLFSVFLFPPLPSYALSYARCIQRRICLRAATKAIHRLASVLLPSPPSRSDQPFVPFDLSFSPPIFPRFRFRLADIRNYGRSLPTVRRSVKETNLTISLLPFFLVSIARNALRLPNTTMYLPTFRSHARTLSRTALSPRDTMNRGYVSSRLIVLNDKKDYGDHGVLRFTRKLARIKGTTIEVLTQGTRGKYRETMHEPVLCVVRVYSCVRFLVRSLNHQPLISRRQRHRRPTWLSPRVRSLHRGPFKFRLCFFLALQGRAAMNWAAALKGRFFRI